MPESRTTKRATPSISEGDVATLGGHAPSRAADSLPRGTSIGRYTILRPLGSGGMGIVYLAQDPELDRQVAIKLLSPGPEGTAMADARAADLLREGRVAARLAHPNVVRVFDVGHFDDELFIAMEFLQGVTLQVWTHQHRKQPAQVLDTLLDAGAGLAAAHDAGLVHADFKPRNVMVTDDGRVVVLDFGLGRGAEPPTDADPVADADDRTTAGPSGTPTYMAPELFDGNLPTALSDQFAYCVTVYEAFVGKRPFADGMPAIVHREAPILPPRGTMPSRVWSIVARGLSADPVDRHPSMTELLRGLRPPRRATTWLPALCIATVGIAASYGVTQDDAPACATVPAELEAMWTQGPRQQLGERHDGPTWSRFAAHLDTWTEQWRSQWLDACAARYVRGSQSGDLFNRRTLCLDRVRVPAQAVVAALTAEAITLADATSSLQALPSPNECADFDALMAGPGLPSDLRTRQAVVDLESEVARVDALAAFASHRESTLAALPGLLHRATELDSFRTTARIHLIRGHVHAFAQEPDAAIEALHIALHDAEAGHDDELAAEIATDLIYALGRESRSELAYAWMRYVRAKLSRVSGNTDRLQVDLRTSEATVLRRIGDYAGSAERLTGVLRDFADSPSLTTVKRSDVYASLAITYRESGQLGDALSAADRAVELRVESLGSDHTLVGHSLYNQATIHLMRAEEQQAREVLERARAILSDDVNSAPQRLAIASLLGSLTAESGDLEQAESILSGAIDRGRAQLPPDTFAFNPVLINLGRVLLLQDRPTEALDAVLAGIKTCEATRGTNYPELDVDYMLLAQVYAALDQPALSAGALERVLAVSRNDRQRKVTEALLLQMREAAASQTP